MKIIKFYAAGLLIYVFAFLPTKVYALVPPLVQFGGLGNFTLPCTCSLTEWGYYTPLYITNVPITGPLVYVPEATEPLPNFLITVPGVFNLGAFIPGVQACWEYAGFFCFPIPSLGVMAFVGSGLPGGI